MTRLLVVDHAHSRVCGIHDLGQRIAECLKQSTMLEVTHLDIADVNGWRNALAIVQPDVVIVNYRPDLMPWIPTALDLAYDLPITMFAVLHQYEAATADQRAHEILAYGFHHIIALDPMLEPTEPRLHAVGRPILPSVEHYGATDDPVAVGSFGFAFPHKGFDQVAAEINDQCDEAFYTLHMPEAYFNGANGAELYTPAILDACRNKITKPGIELWYTNDHITEDELIERLSRNDVNCLLYHPGQPDAGLSSAVDYLIAARRPMLLSEADMFRAVPDAPRWPTTRLGDILDNYDKYQREADELYDWHAGRFLADIESLVAAL